VNKNTGNATITETLPVRQDISALVENGVLISN
jgi:hypothetical protein